MNKTILMIIVVLASILATCLSAKPKMRLSEASMLMGEREEDDLEPKAKRPAASKTKENAETDAGLYRGYAPHGYGWPHYPNIPKPIRPVINPWTGIGNLGAYGLPGGFGWGGWGWGRPSLFGWLF